MINYLKSVQEDHERKMFNVDETEIMQQFARRSWWEPHALQTIQSADCFVGLCIQSLKSPGKTGPKRKQRYSQMRTICT